MTERALVQLPNGDLWRGMPDPAVDTANVVMDGGPRPFKGIDEAMSAILKASKGAHELTCIYCGLQGQTKEMREHLKTQHASAVNPPTEADLQAAAALLQNSK